MPRQLRHVIVLALSALVLGPAIVRAQTLDDPQTLLAAYAAIVSAYRDGSADAEQREPGHDFRPRWHVAAGHELLAGADVEAAREFLTRSCELLPTEPRVRLLCGIAVTTYACRLKTTPPDLERMLIRRGARQSALAEDDRRLIAARAALLEDSAGARAAFLGILDDFRAGYVLTYAPEGVSSAGWHPIDVRLRGARGDVRARRGYTRP